MKKQPIENNVELLHFIFEKELKPPFRKGEETRENNFRYYNSDNEQIGWVLAGGVFVLNFNPFFRQIEHQVKLVFKFNPKTEEWWFAVKPYLKSWLEDQLNDYGDKNISVSLY